MKSKLIVTMIKIAMDLRLLVGYKLVDLDSWNKLNLQISDHNKRDEQSVNEVLYWQNQDSELNKRISVLSLENNKLSVDFRQISDRLTETTNEVEIANSEMLILRASLDEGTELSKQLKEALDRWTS